MNVRIHDVVTITEEICDYGGGDFFTRTLNVVDKKGNHYSFTLFGANATDLDSKEVKNEEYSV